MISNVRFKNNNTVNMRTSSFQVLFLVLSFITFFSLLIIPTTATATTTTSKPHRLAIKLIHQNSFLSPFYNPKATLLDRADRAFRSSIARLAYLKGKIERSSFATDDTRAGIVADNLGSTFLANFSIGTPPFQTLLSMDTGSDLLWMQCVPCSDDYCYEQSIPMFDRSLSSTYSWLSCDSPFCVILPRADACDPSHHCKYGYKYADNTHTRGLLATDVLTFETSDEGITTLPNIIFGCGFENSGRSMSQQAGVLGLGNLNISLVSQLGSDRKFSYCFGNISDPSYNNNQLILGAGAKIQGYSTPMEFDDGFYYLTLEGISVGTERLGIKPGTFQRTDSGGGVIIDSGTTFTFLLTDAYNMLSDAIQKLLNMQLNRITVPGNSIRLCYNGTVSRDLIGFPTVTFSFADGAELVLEQWSMFEQYQEDILCMAALPDRSMSTIGTMAQQYYNVGYDLVDKKVYFELIDCHLLDD